MSTNPIGPGTVNVTVNMPDPLKKKLKVLADKSDVSLNALANAVLADYAEKEVALSKPEIVLKKSPTKKTRGAKHGA